MFTGIIEQLGEIRQITKEKDNIHFTLFSPFTSELKIDQSVSHNGTCLTVVDIQGDLYTVTAILETLNTEVLELLRFLRSLWNHIRGSIKLQFGLKICRYVET